MGGSESTANGPGGFRLYHIWKGSPAHIAGLEMFFDCIIQVDGRSFINSRMSPDEFPRAIAACEGRTIQLVIYNSRTRAFRDVWVKPQVWSGDRLGLLGASVRYENDITAPNEPLRVLQVAPGSPASAAGLQPDTDFILATSGAPLKSADELIDRMLTSLQSGGGPVSLLVYSSKQDAVREVKINPDYSWGGGGCLGCDIGQGLLHTIPQPARPHPGSYNQYQQQQMHRYAHSGDVSSHNDNSNSSAGNTATDAVGHGGTNGGDTNDMQSGGSSNRAQGQFPPQHYQQNQIGHPSPPLAAPQSTQSFGDLDSTRQGGERGYWDTNDQSNGEINRNGTSSWPPSSSKDSPNTNQVSSSPSPYFQQQGADFAATTASTMDGFSSCNSIQNGSGQPTAAMPTPTRFPNEGSGMPQLEGKCSPPRPGVVYQISAS